MLGDYGTNMAMAMQQKRKIRPPLDANRLEEMALNYVGRFATSRSKLIAYLERKLRERGWGGAEDPPVEALADRMVRLGYVDDCAFAMSKARSLAARGYGQRRLRQALAQAGIAEEEAGSAHALAEEQAVEAALKFAKRRSIGPFAAHQFGPAERERALAAMIRAGHPFSVAKAITDLNPGENPDFGEPFNLR